MTTKAGQELIIKMKSEGWIYAGGEQGRHNNYWKLISKSYKRGEYFDLLQHFTFVEVYKLITANCFVKQT